jgi:hypothetical protein
MDQRERYRLVRYDYYHAGRILHLMGNFHSACIMLGYTIEITMKAGLLEIQSEVPQNDKKEMNRILMRSHDVKEIYSKCREYSLFDYVKVSDDFLEHIDYHFQRYPSQMKTALDNATEKNDVIGNSVDWVYYYDDLIVQLDDYLLSKTSDPMISIIYHAIYTLETKYARDILQENAFAILKFNKYAELVRRNMPLRDDLKKQIEDNLTKGALFYWNSEDKQIITNEHIAVIAQKFSASAFKLPKWKLKNGHWETVIP